MARPSHVGMYMGKPYSAGRGGKWRERAGGGRGAGRRGTGEGDSEGDGEGDSEGDSECDDKGAVEEEKKERKEEKEEEEGEREGEGSRARGLNRHFKYRNHWWIHDPKERRKAERRAANVTICSRARRRGSESGIRSMIGGRFIWKPAGVSKMTRPMW